MSISFSFDEKNISVVLDETNLQISNLEQNVQVNLENQFKIEDLSDKTLVKILMLKGEKGDTGATTGASWGYITGNITDQTDLKNALNSKVNANYLSTVAISGSYNDLTNKPTIPSKTSDLTNDSGFIDAETDPVFTNSVAHEITSTDITNWNNKSTFSGNYNDLTNKPTIPDELSDLSDDSTHRLVTDTEKSTWNAKSDFSGSYNDLSNKPNIPTKTSDLTNDSGFVTSNYHDSTKQDTLVSGENIKTINGVPVLGSGNIEISSGGQGVPTGGTTGQILTKKSDTDYDTEWADINGQVLYDNSTGTNGTVTLSDSAANYDYLEIYFRTNDSTDYKNSVKIYSPDNALVPLSYPLVATNGTAIYWKIKTVRVSGNSIFFSDGSRYAEATIKATTSISQKNYVYITRVVGYR